MRKEQVITNESVNPAMSVSEVAELTTLSRRSIGRMCEDGRLRAVRIGRRWLINRADFMTKFADAISQ